MRFAFRSILARGACALLVAGSCAQAAAVRLQPDCEKGSPGKLVTVRLIGGADGQARLDVSCADVFQRIWKYGRADLAPDASDAAAVTFRPERAGSNLVVFGSDRHGAYAKTIVLVGPARAGEPLRWSEVGQRLEIVPQTDPVKIADAGGTLEVQVLFEREPLADARVELAPVAGTSGRAASAVTDEIGIVRLPLSGPGWWVARVEHRPGAAAGPPSLTASLTIHAGSASR